MNLFEAKRILNQYGYELDKTRQLEECRKTLSKYGYLMVEAEGDDSFEEDNEESKEKADNEDIPAAEDLSVQEKHSLKQILTSLRSNKNYADFIKALKSIKTSQLGALQSLVGSGKHAKPVSMKKGSLPVSVLHPTQQEIDVNNSLYYPLNKDPKGVPEILQGNKAITINDSPIIVYKAPDGKYYIIDGHHRWSQVFLLNPNDKMKVLLFSAPDKNESPVSMLRDFQLVIKAVTGKVKVSDADSKYNIYTMSDEAIKKYVLKVMTDEALEVWKGVNEKFSSKEVVADYVVKNAVQLKKNNAPAEGAPRRNIMPQTDSETLAVAAKGMTNV